MLEIMKLPRNPNRIRQYLKPEIETSRKTGGSGRIKADVGILYLPSGPLVIAGIATADDREGGNLGIEAIAEVSRMAIETVSPESLLAE
jgi:beta-lactamase class A